MLDPHEGLAAGLNGRIICADFFKQVLKILFSQKMILSITQTQDRASP
jgi:hypothetical protein